MHDLPYPFTVRPLTEEDGGGWLVEFPDLPGCMADGETVDDALREAVDAAQSWLETARAHGDPIPEPTPMDLNAWSGKWVIRTPKSLHRRLAERAKADGVSLNTLAVTLIAEALGRREGAG